MASLHSDLSELHTQQTKELLCLRILQCWSLCKSSRHHFNKGTLMLAMCSSISLCQIKLEMWLKKSQVNKIKVHKSKKGFVQDPPIYSAPIPRLSTHRTQDPRTKGDSPKPCWGRLPTIRTLASLAFLPQRQLLLPPPHRPVAATFYNLESSRLSLPE